MNFAPLWAAATTLASPVLRIMLRLRVRRGKEILERLAERRGVETTPRPRGRLVWLHAASVGETVSVLPVLASLAEQSPSTTLLLTTGTVTSARLLALRLPEFRLEQRVIHRFAPLDVPAWAARFVDHWRPDVVGFVESELWPNLVRACRVRSIPLMLINARLSPRSFARWRRVPAAASAVLSGFTRIEAQSCADAERLRVLGACSVSVPGNLKFASSTLPVDEAELRRLRDEIGTRPVWLAASTHPGEEPLIFAAHRMLAATHPRLLTIVAPRHPERGAAVLAVAGATSATRRGAGEGPPPGEGVWIVDTLGELGLLYRLAGTAFVGRSLVLPGGGQNPLEGARLGCAIAVGQHTANFSEIVGVLGTDGALVRVNDVSGLTDWVARMIGQPAVRDAIGRAGVRAAARYADLADRTATTLLSLMTRSTRPDSG